LFREINLFYSFVLFPSLEKEIFHVIEVIELAIAEAWWAVSIVAVNAEVAIFVASDHILAPVALAGHVFHVLGDH